VVLVTRNNRVKTPPPVAKREADDRIVHLLGELQESRNEMAAALPDYIHALKRWTALVEAMTKGSIDMVDALFSRYDLGDMTDAQIAKVVERTDHERNPDATWRTLNEAAERFYRARIAFVTRQAAFTGYLQYVERLGIDGRDREDVPSMLIGKMMDAAEGTKMEFEF
jgi:hypothetical protein